MKKQTLVWSFLLLGLLAGATAQERNASGLLGEPSFVGPVSNALFPPNILFADTAIAVRNVLMFVITAWDSFAVCDPAQTALNFFGGVQRLPQEVCGAPDTAAELFAYSYLRAAEKEFPEPGQLYAQIMRDNGYDPEDRSVDPTTAVGMGNIIGVRAAEWMGKDGWNSRGDLSRDSFRKPFEDYTGYEPVNTARELKYPLRWQPLVDSDPKFGRFTVQEHVVPFLGYVKPYLMSQEEYVSRYVEFPYSDVNVTELSGEDAENMDMLVKQVARASADSTSYQRALARWFDNKFVSIGVFGFTYGLLLDFDAGFTSRWFLGEGLAQHDAMLLAWKEKRRIDAVRPKTIINNFYADKDLEVFVSSEEGVKFVKGKDWEPLIPTQPHSEFPSASASLCTAFADHGARMLQEHMEANGLTEEPEITLNDFNAPDVIISQTRNFTFKSVKEAGRLCGESRVWAGVHFPPSVPAGEKLVEGLGQKAYEFAKELSEGIVPAACWWCTG